MHHRALESAVAAGILVLSSTVSAGAGETDPDGSLDQLVVVANRAPEPLYRIGNSITVLDAAAIKDSQSVVISDLLAQTPGVTVARNGGVGQPTSIYIRGAESDQTVLVIDGVVLNDPSLPGGGFDFAHLTSGDIARIEILRGAQSTLYGSQAMGGIVNISTAEPADAFGGGFSAEGGSHDTGYFTANAGGKSGALLWRLAGSYYGSSGIPAYDAQFGGMRLCASQIGGGTGQLRYDFTPDLQIDLRGYYSQSRVDFDGYDTPSTGFTAFGDDNEYGKTREFLGYAGLSLRSPEHGLNSRIAFQYTDSVSRDYDPNAPIDGYGLSASPVTYYGFGRNMREEYQGTWRFAPASDLTFGAQHERSTIDTDTPAYEVAPMPLRRAATINSAYAQLQSEVLTGLTLTAGTRYDHHDVFGGHSSSQLAAAWLLADRETVLRASFGQGFKSPSLYQLYSNYGNLALRPEQASSWDLGVETRAAGGRAVLSATYFERSSRDLINFFSCPAANALCLTEPQGFYANIARSRARGVELQGRIDLGERIALSANYTLTESKDLSPGSANYGNQLPNRPRNAANASATYRSPARLSATLALRYSGPSLDEAFGPVTLGGYVLADLRLSYQALERLEIYGRVENIGGRHYETNYEYGTFGRVAYAGVRATF